MDVTSAVLKRRSTRAFLDRPIEPALLRRILETAARAPSNSNIQPWHVHLVTGGTLDRLKAATAERAAFPPKFDQLAYHIYPDPLEDPYARRRFECGERQYGVRGIAREDHEGRLRYVYGNHQLFGAPAGLFLFCEKHMDLSQWADLGIYLQTVLLLLTEAGIDSIAQISWCLVHETLKEVLGVGENMMLYCGVSIGYGDPNDPINAIESDRAALDDTVTFHD